MEHLGVGILDLASSEEVNWQCHLLGFPPAANKSNRKEGNQSGCVGGAFKCEQCGNTFEHQKHLKIHKWKSRRATSLRKEVN